VVFGEPASDRAALTEPATDEPVAEHWGVNVHAKECVDGRDRRRLERLCRYITRPPVAQDRLERLADGRLELSFKRPWKDGTRAVVLEPDDLMVRLVAAVPPPRWHLLRYFGLLSSHSSRRKEVVPESPADPTAHAPPPAKGDQLELGLDENKDEPPSRRKRWAWLLRHVLAADSDRFDHTGSSLCRSGADRTPHRRQSARLEAKMYPKDADPAAVRGARSQLPPGPVADLFPIASSLPRPAGLNRFSQVELPWRRPPA
jgi:hypothetical protein